MQPKPEFLNPDDFPEPHMEPVEVSEAERLAREIDGARYGDVAAELRRLAAVERERDDLERDVNDLVSLSESRKVLHAGERMMRQLKEADVERITADRDRLAAEVESLRADAERYRWLREHGDAGCTEKDGYGGQTLRMGEWLDAAIDAARASGA